MTRTAGALHIAAALAATLLLIGAAQADCVGTLSYCAQRCDQRTKEGDPERPQCARACVSNYQQCAKIERLQSTTPQSGGPDKGILSPQ